ncbi:hypothetical protein AB0941_39795 [Streptomyces sp. NPDC013433]|uniref:hypothetical protein n=1 Tax=Streptomyces sp. NPDC013433 TaxID=3155604 RepID=UPI0034545069
MTQPYDDCPPAGTLAYVGTTGTPSPKDIVMNWEGTCTNPGVVHRLATGGSGWTGAAEEVHCYQDGTYRAAIMIRDYERFGLKLGESFDYMASLRTEEGPVAYSKFSGTATL